VDLVGELEKLPSDVDLVAGEFARVGPIRRACFDTISFAAVADGVGANFTQESFLAALER